MMKLSRTVGDKLDFFVLSQLVQKVKQDLAEQDQPAVDGSQHAMDPKVKAVSAVLCSFTPEKFFERRPGDNPQLATADELGVRRALWGRVNVGRLVIVDEVLAYFRSFGHRRNFSGGERLFYEEQGHYDESHQ